MLVMLQLLRKKLAIIYYYINVYRLVLLILNNVTYEIII
jgi:hypothetical protein